MRYRRKEDPFIRISGGRSGSQIAITVSDNGIGIPAHELPRVFERGFTGSNGRSLGGATGMGLYLCRKLSACMEAELQIFSEEGKGTQVMVIFPVRDAESGAGKSF